MGDWFVLVQLCRNVNVYFYREFIKGLANELRANPKLQGTIRHLVLTNSAFMTGARENAETRASISAENPAHPSPEKEKEPERSKAFLRIEHEHKLRPHLQQGRGRGRGRKGGKGRGKRLII